MLGVRGGGWSAVVNERGSVTLDDGSPTLLWHVAADDRGTTQQKSQVFASSDGRVCRL